MDSSTLCKASFARAPTEFPYPDQSSARLNGDKKARHWGREPLESAVFWQWEADPKWVVQHQKDLCYITLHHITSHYITLQYITCAHNSMLTSTRAESVNASSFPRCTLLHTHFAIPDDVVIQSHTFFIRTVSYLLCGCTQFCAFLCWQLHFATSLQTYFPRIRHGFN